MYDEKSLCRLLGDIGFIEATSLMPGQTRIKTPGELDLKERADESLYVEAVRA